MTNQATRSTSYPAIDLEEALNRLVNFKQSLGVNGKFDRETVVKAIGYKSVSGASARSVAALVQFGLLDRDKDLYALSQLGRRYLMPIEEGEESQAVREAALEPKLFKQIFADYSGHVLPQQLTNILAINHGIQAKAAPRVVKTIEATFKYAGFVANDGTLASGTVSALDDEKEEMPFRVEADGTMLPEATTTAMTRTPAVQALGNAAGRQSVTHTGDGWSVTVVFEKTRELDTDIRREVRALMNAAEDLSDKLYDLDSAESRREVQ